MVNSSLASRECSRTLPSSNSVIISRRSNNSRRGLRRYPRSSSWIIWLWREMCTLDATSHFVEPWSVRIFFCCFLVCYWPLVAIVVANEGQRIDIPDGCILENRLLSGNLNMIVRPISSTTYHSSNEIYLGSLISSAQDSIYGHFVVFHWTITFSVSPYFVLDPIHVACSM